MKSPIKYLFVMAVLIFFGFAAHNLDVKEQRLDIKTIELEDTSAKLKTLETKYNDLNTTLDKELQQKDQNSQKIKELEEQRKQLEQEKIELQKQVQAKAAERQKLAAATGYASASSGDHNAWLAAAGIPQSDWGYANTIIAPESGWNPCAHYPSKSDCGYTGNAACGIPQALPCSKLRDVAGCKMTDAVCQLRWQYGYVKARYGGYAGAVSFRAVHGWY